MIAFLMYSLFIRPHVPYFNPVVLEILSSFTMFEFQKLPWTILLAGEQPLLLSLSYRVSATASTATIVPWLHSSYWPIWWAKYWRRTAHMPGGYFDFFTHRETLNTVHSYDGWCLKWRVQYALLTATLPITCRIQGFLLGVTPLSQISQKKLAFQKLQALFLLGHSTCCSQCVVAIQIQYSHYYQLLVSFLRWCLRFYHLESKK